MRHNRSMPSCTVIPELAYGDVPPAAAWLCAAFGFAQRLMIADHRAQLALDDGAVVLTRREGEAVPAGHAVMVRVDDADAHCAHARSAGAVILREPADQPYGERQYTACDVGGHVWTFSQTIADVAPEDWGGRAG